MGTICYSPLNRSLKKQITVPISAQFPDEELVALTLRDGRSLRLEFCDYDNNTLKPQRGRIGGLVSGDYGIVCKLKVMEENVGYSIVAKVETAMRKTYVPPDEEDLFESFKIYKP